MSLLAAAERFASMDRSNIVLDTKRCLYSQDQYSECAACFSICPVQAISAGEPPVLNSELCQSCLACLPTCPVGAYRADDDVADLLNCATHIEEQTIELVCGLHPHPECGIDSESIGIQIRGCLAGLVTGAYLTLSTLGVARILSRTDACCACKWQSLGCEIHNQIKRANRFLSMWDKADSVICVDNIESRVERVLWNAKNPPVSRRDLFRLMARQGQLTMARAMENGVATTERKPGRDRLRLLSAVSHLREIHKPAPEIQNVLDGFDFATITISDSCTACGACGKACPTQALKFEKNDEELTFSISFLAKNCIGCDICAHVCMPDAITLHHAPTFEDIFGAKEPAIAESGLLVRCERCKTLMAKRGDVTLCTLCEYRRTHPFGSMMPKKMVRETYS